jgi:bacterioferritin-associated ferredoxin
MYLCLCKGLTESDVQRLCHKNAQCPDAVVKTLGLEDDECCGRCARNIHEFLAFTAPSHTHHCHGEARKPTGRIEISGAKRDSFP